MGLSVKGDDAHFVEVDEESGKAVYHIKTGVDFTVNVNLKGLSNLPDKDSPPNGGGYVEIFADVAWDSEILDVKTADVVVSGCTDPEDGEIEPSATTPQLLDCLAFDAAQSSESQDTGKIFELTMNCTTAGEVIVSLTVGGLIDEFDVEKAPPVNVHLTQPLNVLCVNAIFDNKDGDQCIHAQEKGIGLDPNVYVGCENSHC